MSQAFIGESRLFQLANQLTGEENIYVGLRPRGIHAGNKIPAIIYPYLLGELLEYRGITPKFHFHYFINDYEQYTLTGPDTKKYPFNALPEGRTLQYEPYKDGVTSADYWYPRIKKEVEKVLSPRFKQVELKFIRNSSMKNFPVFKETVMKTIQNPAKMRNLFRAYSAKEIIVSPSKYCMAVCRNCKRPVYDTQVVDENTLKYSCKECKNSESALYSDLDYWFYHKPLAIPRIKHYNIDLCITGSDHLNEGDLKIREKLFEFFDIEVKPFKTLYTPILIGSDGILKMSKSKDNYYDLEFSELYELIRNNLNEGRIYNEHK